MSEKTFVIISGYNGSGASAIIDMLLEYDEFYYNGTEMRLICDPYGIKQLERAVTEDWDWINASIAVQDYLNFAKCCARKGGGRNPFAKSGLNYSSNINKKFNEITQNYIQKITSFKYYGEFYSDKLKMNRLQHSMSRIRCGIEVYSKGRIPLANRKKLNYYSSPTKQEFCKATKEYFEELFDDEKYKKKKYIIMDLALAPRDALRMYDYFENAKMIIVDRDARDLLLDNIGIGLYTKEWGYKNAGRKYVEWQKKMRENLPHDKNILYLNFEEAVLNPDETRGKVLSFLGIEYRMPDRPLTSFFPDKSAHNIGIWKKWYNQYHNAIDYVAEKMPSSLYSLEKKKKDNNT